MYDLTTEDHDYPRTQQPPRRTIVLCSQPRSGSTLLGEALYFAGDLGVPLEYFHIGFRPQLEKQWGVKGMPDFLQAVHGRRTSPSGTFGVKLFWQDVEQIAQELSPQIGLASARISAEVYREIHRLLEPLIPNPIFLHLERRDIVRKAVSSHIAIESGRWRHIPGIEEKHARRMPEYSYDRIASAIAYTHRARERWDGFFSANGITPFRVFYEDLQRDYAGTVRGVLDYLGNTADVPPVRMQRQRDDLSEEFVRRFIREYFERRSHTLNETGSLSPVT